MTSNPITVTYNSMQRSEKVLIEDTRFYSANFGLMSGTASNNIEQAKQYQEDRHRARDGQSGRKTVSLAR